MNKESILYYYRTIIQKSRSFFARHTSGSRIDIFIFVVALVVLAVVASSRFIRPVDQPNKRIDIFISPNSETLFGKDTISAFVLEFEEQNPELRIQVAIDGDADIVFFDEGEISGLMAASALASLKPYIVSESESGEWVVPLVSFMDVFLYNIDILKSVNLDRPPRTRAEFLAAARAVAARGAAFPLAFGLSEEDPLALRNELYPWIWANGGDLRQGPQGDDEGVTLSRAATEAISFFGQLSREGLLAPGSLEKTKAQRIEEFAQGNISMMVASSRDIPLLQRSAPDLNFSITAIPQATQRKNRLGISGIYGGVSSGCALPDEAWSFLAFIAGKKQVLEELLGAVPGSYPTSAFPSGYIIKDPLFSKAWDIFEAADIVEYYPAGPLEEQTSRIIRERLEESFE